MSEITEDGLRFLAEQATKAAGPSTPVTVFDGQDGKSPTIILAPEQQLTNVEHLYPNRSRFRGILNTSSLADFAEYTKERSAELSLTVPVFIDPDSVKATAFFNLGSREHPGHGDDRAQLALRKTAAYAAVVDLVQRPIDQRSFAEFVEDWRDVIKAFTGVNEDGSYQVSTIPRAIMAVRKVTIESLSRSDTAVGDMSATQSTLASIEAKSVEALPIALGFRCVPYEGLPERELVLRVSILTGAKEPMFRVRLVRAEDVLERIAQDFKAVLAEKLSGSSSLTVGVFTP